ncbi:hypothetical protein Esti_002029 [Eimeria stiedai]
MSQEEREKYKQVLAEHKGVETSISSKQQQREEEARGTQLVEVSEAASVCTASSSRSLCFDDLHAKTSLSRHAVGKGSAAAAAGAGVRSSSSSGCRSSCAAGASLSVPRTTRRVCLSSPAKPSILSSSSNSSSSSSKSRRHAFVQPGPPAADGSEDGGWSTTARQEERHSRIAARRNTGPQQLSAEQKAELALLFSRKQLPL